jgi:hypothetical protein
VVPPVVSLEGLALGVPVELTWVVFDRAEEGVVAVGAPAQPAKTSKHMRLTIEARRLPTAMGGPLHTKTVLIVPEQIRDKTLPDRLAKSA